MAERPRRRRCGPEIVDRPTESSCKYSRRPELTLRRHDVGSTADAAGKSRVELVGVDSRRCRDTGECGDQARLAVASDQDIRLRNLGPGRIRRVATASRTRATSPFLGIAERNGTELDPAGEALIITCSQRTDDGMPPPEGRTWMDPEPAAGATHAEPFGETLAVIVPEEQLLAIRCWRPCQVAERPAAAGAEVTLPSAEGAPPLRARVTTAWTADPVGEARGADRFEEAIELGRVDAESIHGPEFFAKTGALP